MIKYRVFRWERERGVLGIEYGERGSGLTVPVSLLDMVAPGVKITADVLHQVAIAACPLATVKKLRRIEAMPKDEQDAIAAAVDQERQISDAEELRHPDKVRPEIPVVDTSKP